MKIKIAILFLLIFVLSQFSFSLEDMNIAADDSGTGSELNYEVAIIFKEDCSTSGCHRGNYPKKKLNLEEDKFLQALINVPSLEVETLKLVDTKNPDKSYLLMKIRGDEGIVDDRMPVDAPPLKDEEIKIIENWVLSLAEMDKSQILPKSKKKARQINKSLYDNFVFNSTQLINLPTPKTAGHKNILFRISHRFDLPINSGFNNYYGLNGPAKILFSLGYGIKENLDVTIGHSNLNHEFELAIKWLPVNQNNKYKFPVSIALLGSGSLITAPEPCKRAWRSENMKFNLQISIARQLSNQISFLIVPAFSSNTKILDPLSKNTLALGTGGRYLFKKNISIICEWMPVLSGYKTSSNSWGLGLEYKTGGHVFQLFVNNSTGLTSDQYISGGDLKLFDNDYRLGFNIFRYFWL